MKTKPISFTVMLFLLLGMSTHAHAQMTTVTVQLKVPDGGWSIRISKVYRTKSHLLVVSELQRKQGLAIQAIQNVKDSAKVRAPELPIQHFILGKTWGRKNQEPYTFLQNPTDLAKHTAGALLVYKAKPKAQAARNPRYIVVYREEIFTDGKTRKGENLQQLAERHCKELGGSQPRVLKIINGFAAEFPGESVPKLKALKDVKYVEKDR